MGDLHLDEENSEECVDLVREVMSLEPDVFIHLGDFCHKNTINSKLLVTLTYLGDWIARRTKNRSVLLRGNHDAFDEENSIISYLQFLGNKIINSDEFEGADTIYGHFFTDKSKDAFGKYKYTLEALQKDYKFGFFGHQHDFQRLAPGFYHLGSARYVHFNEDQNIKKRFAVMDDNNIEFIEYSSTIPMFNVSSTEDLKKLPRKSKVRYIYTSFLNMKQEIELINKIKKEFFRFKTKLEFFDKEKNALLEQYNHARGYVPLEMKLGAIFEKWLKTVENTKVKNILEKEFEKELGWK